MTRETDCTWSIVKCLTIHFCLLCRLLYGSDCVVHLHIHDIVTNTLEKFTLLLLRLSETWSNTTSCLLVLITLNYLVDLRSQVNFQFVLKKPLLTDTFPETSNLLRGHLLVRLRWLIQLCKLDQKPIVKYFLGRRTDRVLRHDLDRNGMLTWDDLSVGSDHIVLDIGGFNLKIETTIKTQLFIMYVP